jgi:hypothetical protein
VPAAGRFQGLGHPPDGGVVAFGAAGGKGNLRRVCADKICNLTTGLIEDSFRLLAEVVDAGRVAPVVPGHPCNEVGNGWSRRGRGVVVEVDAHDPTFDRNIAINAQQ